MFRTTPSGRIVERTKVLAAIDDAMSNRVQVARA
jgi:hypothetical protein